jgi:hypothetical protein
MPTAFLLRPANMKPFFFTLLLFFAAAVQAQSSGEKLYGFQQRVIPGAQQAGDYDKDGHFIKKEAPEVFKYLIYMTTSSKQKIYPVQLWINGKAFSIKMDSVQTPVVQHDSNLPNSEGKVLVLKTTGVVLQLIPVPLVADKGNTTLKQLSTKNAVVFYYKKAGKGYHGVLKKLSELSPQSLQ